MLNARAQTAFHKRLCRPCVRVDKVLYSYGFYTLAPQHITLTDRNLVNHIS